MRTLELFKTLPVWLLGACLCMGSVPAYAVDDIGVFELDTRAGVDGDQDKKNDPIPPIVGDGNTIDEAAAGDDWENIYCDRFPANPLCAAIGSSSAFATSFIEDTFANGEINAGAPAWVTARTPEVSFFTGGGSKDTNGIQEGPWLYDTTNDQVPDKNDIVNAFAAAYTDPNDGHTIFYFGMDTYSVNGAANAGFWFFRNEVSLTPLAPGADTGTFTGEHADGDIFVAVAYTEGGRVGTIDVYTWAGDDATGSLQIAFSSQGCAAAPPGDEVCGVINKLMPDDTFGEDPIFNYANTLVANNPGLADSYKYESAAFVEFGLDVTALLGEDIGCFSSFLAETRSSQSPTAQLKDLALGEFDICGVEVAKQCDGDAVLADDGSDVTINWKGTVTSTGAGAIDVVIEDINDSGVDSVYDAVCIDGATGPMNGQCGDADDTAVTFTDNGDGTASFSLGGNETALVQAHYVVPVPADPLGAGFDLDFDDHLYVEAFEPGDDPDVDDPVDTSTSATVTCSAPDNPAITVAKTCAPSFTGGDTFTANVQFRVVNIGNILLDTFSVSDNSSEGENTEAGFSYCIDNTAGESVGPTGAGCDVVTTLAAASLEIGEALVGYDTYIHTNDGITSHADTVTVSAQSAFTDQSTGDVDDSTGLGEGEGELCAISPNPEVLVIKECDTDLGGGTGVDLVPENGVLVVRVGAVITVTNTGNEDIQITITDPKLTDLDDDIITNGSVLDGCTGDTDTCVLALEHDPDGAGVSLGGTATLSGTYKPSMTDDNQQLPSTADFTNLVQLSGAGTLTGSPVAKAEGTDLDATCKLCPPCPDCEPE